MKMENKNMNEDDNIKTTFETTDLYLAASLKTANIALVNVKKGDDNKVRFVFSYNGNDNSKINIDKIKEDYYLGNLCQSIKIYVMNWKTLRKAIDNVLYGEGKRK